jgi:5-(carboxyamino)imidazole ribonucleotide synthase
MRPRVGIVGAGQLARMMHQAAIGPGIDVVVLANDDDESAAQVARHRVIGSPDELEALRRLARACDLVTFDHELVDPEHLAALADDGHVLRPGPATLETAVNKLRQRQRFAAADLPLPAWAPARTKHDALEFALQHSWPVVVKSARGGYDGRGVWICASERELDDVPWDQVSYGFVVEEHVAIDLEIAVLVVRRPAGETRVYPVVETLQRDGICHEVVAPARLPTEVIDEARRIGFAVAETVESIGNLAIEMFVSGGRVLINEIAARPHNSGHFSIEGCVTSQFENHLRAVLDWPLGDTGMTAPAAAMVNMLGTAMPGDPGDLVSEALAVEGSHVHWYGKGNRPGRKLGHVTALASTPDDALAIARRAAARLGQATRSD